jgi:trans-aconitate methyltransferase
VGFDVVATAYDRFMGHWSRPLAEQVVERLDPQMGDRALDVGCGPGVLTAVLVDRLGADAVAAVDPSAPFVEAACARLPGVDVRRAKAEQLPFPDDAVDLAVANLVVHFMRDPVGGLAEMARVARPGGRVAATVWDHAGGTGPLGTFWDVARELETSVTDESGLAGARRGHLLELAASAGLEEAAEDLLTVTRRFATFEDWWAPFELGVGPAGDHVATLSPTGREEFRDALRDRLGDGPFELGASAWFVVGRVPG